MYTVLKRFTSLILTNHTFRISVYQKENGVLKMADGQNEEVKMEVDDVLTNFWQVRILSGFKTYLLLYNFILFRTLSQTK